MSRYPTGNLFSAPKQAAYSAPQDLHLTASEETWASEHGGHFWDTPAYWAEYQEVFRHTHCMVFILSLKYLTVCYFDVSWGIAKIRLFQLACNHTDSVHSVNLVGKCFILAWTKHTAFFCVAVWLHHSCFGCENLAYTSSPCMKRDSSALRSPVVPVLWTCCSLLWGYGKLPNVFPEYCSTDAGKVVLPQIPI